MNTTREYWYKKFPISEKCFYCSNPIDRMTSQRILRVLEDDRYVLADVCLKCLPTVRANVLKKGATVIDHNAKTVVSSHPNHINEILNEADKN
jgi:hypothetical protein